VSAVRLARWSVVGAVYWCSVVLVSSVIRGRWVSTPCVNLSCMCRSHCRPTVKVCARLFCSASPRCHDTGGQSRRRGPGSIWTIPYLQLRSSCDDPGRRTCLGLCVVVTWTRSSKTRHRKMTWQTSSSCYTGQNAVASLKRITGNKFKYFSPVRDWRSTPTYCQLQSHVTQKLGQKLKIRPR